MSTAKYLSEPWHSFLRELDDAVDEPVRLDCIGGFVVTRRDRACGPGKPLTVY